MMLLYMLPLLSSTLMRMMQESSSCWLYTGGGTVEVMEVTETERLWALGLLLQGRGEDRGLAKDDIPEELVSMEWMEEHDEDDSESCKREHAPEGHGAVRTLANGGRHSSQSRAAGTDACQ